MKPGNLTPRDESSGTTQEQDVDRGGGGGGEPPKIDPIIQGLLSRLPKSGDVWLEADRKLWLELLSGSFKLIYKDKTAGGVPDYTDPEYRKRREAHIRRSGNTDDEDSGGGDFMTS